MGKHIAAKYVKRLHPRVKELSIILKEVVDSLESISPDDRKKAHKEITVKLAEWEIDTADRWARRASFNKMVKEMNAQLNMGIVDAF